MALAAAVTVLAAHGAPAGQAAAEKRINSEFQPSVLCKTGRMQERQWFIEAAEPCKSMAINVL